MKKEITTSSIPSPNSPPSRVNRTSTEMFPLIESWQEGNQSPKAFCESHNLAPHVFNYWRSKYRSESDSSSGFVELNLEEAPQSSIELVLAGGLALRFSDLVPVSYLVELLGKLGKC